VRDHGDERTVWAARLRPRFVRAVMAVVVGGALTACSSAPAVEPSPSPTMTETPTVTETPTPDDPYAIPDEITPEYVDLIANTIYGIWGDMIRELLAAPLDPGPLDPELIQKHGALFAGEELLRRVKEAEDAQGNQTERDKWQPPDEIGQVRFRTVSITEANESCIVAIGEIDISETAVGGRPYEILFALSLQPKQPDQDPTLANPTPWAVRDQLANTDPNGTPKPDDDMLNAAVTDFGGSLEHTCEVST
jgi:hypothetical protein